MSITERNDSTVQQKRLRFKNGNVETGGAQWSRFLDNDELALFRVWQLVLKAFYTPIPIQEDNQMILKQTETHLNTNDRESLSAKYP